MLKIIKRYYLNRLLGSITYYDYFLCLQFRKLGKIGRIFLKEERNILEKMIGFDRPIIDTCKYIPKEYFYKFQDTVFREDLKFLTRRKIVQCWIYLLDYDWSIKDKVEYIDKELREYLLKIVQGEK